MEKTITTIQQDRWWRKGECVVRILSRGHYPDTAKVRLPNDIETEVYICDLENPPPSLAVNGQ